VDLFPVYLRYLRAVSRVQPLGRACRRVHCLIREDSPTLTETIVSTTSATYVGIGERSTARNRDASGHCIVRSHDLVGILPATALG
jgi:hypothetical protein